MWEMSDSGEAPLPARLPAARLAQRRGPVVGVGSREHVLSTLTPLSSQIGQVGASRAPPAGRPPLDFLPPRPSPKGTQHTPFRTPLVSSPYQTLQSQTLCGQDASSSGPHGEVTGCYKSSHCISSAPLPPCRPASAKSRFLQAREN